MGRTYLITGGAGFIGANLCAQLRLREPEVRLVIVDDFRSGSYATLVEVFAAAGAGPVEGQVIAESTAEIDLAMLCEAHDPAAVFHLAAITDTTVRDQRVMIRDNTEGFEDLIRACHEARRPLVYASSAATYGSPPQGFERVPFPEEAAGKPNNVYGFSKWLMECVHRKLDGELADDGDRPWVVGLRYFNVFGPGEAAKGQMASMPYQLARQMLEGRRPRIFTDGRQARDQVSVHDVVGCTLAAAGLGERPNPEPGVYNLGSGRATSFNEIVAALREALDISEQRLPTEYFEMPPHIAEHYQEYTCADMRAAEAGLGWKPEHEPRAAIMAYGRYLAEQHGRAG
jgi:ADP-L-glycero-D-manno-heptose 6-epimerase